MTECNWWHFWRYLSTQHKRRCIKIAGEYTLFLLISLGLTRVNTFHEFAGDGPPARWHGDSENSELVCGSVDPTGNKSSVGPMIPTQVLTDCQTVYPKLVVTLMKRTTIAFSRARGVPDPAIHNMCMAEQEHRQQKLLSALRNRHRGHESHLYQRALWKHRVTSACNKKERINWKKLIKFLFYFKLFTIMQIIFYLFLFINFLFNFY